MKKRALISILATTILTLNSQALAEQILPLAAQNNNKDIKQSSSNIVTDASITASVKAKIISDSEVSIFNIDVETVDSVVKLIGKVPDQASINKIINLANTVSDVKEVVSLLEIDPNESKKSSTLGNLIPDSTITTAIKTKFLADSKVGVFDIHVETINGIVTLTGKVNSASEAAQALSIAKSTKGVKHVITKIVVK